MVDILETVPDIARGLFKGDQTQFWNEMAEHLNALGPPMRSGTTWKRVWFDYKCAVKKKLRANKTSLLATGGGPFNQKVLNEVEEQVANLTNLHATLEGNSARSFGTTHDTLDKNNNSSCEQEHMLIELPNEGEIQQQTATQAQPRKKRIKRKNTEEVLRQNRELLDLMRQNIEAQKEATVALKEATVTFKAATEQLIQNIHRN
uniref:Regulatory protein zeste n=1 Tax=Anopheles maculatus TaxID=74869 RepID=A0A182T516_9DIPT